MWTQRDQIQAYQFLRRRLVSALVSADANHPISPSRRLVLGTVLGLIATLLVTAAFGIVGLLHPSTGSDWKKPGQVVIEKETGSRFVLAGDGLLHPVLNFASARLLAGGDGSRTSTVPAKQLATVPRGAELGIPGAPDSIPSAGRISTGPLTVCSVPAPDQPADAVPTTVLRWSASLPGRGLPANQALLVTDGQSRQLISAGHRFRLPGAGQAAALGVAGAGSTVSPAWLSAVPAGGDLDFLTVAGAGQPGPQLGSGRLPVGSVLSLSQPALPGQPALASQLYLVLKAGIASVSQVQAQLALANPANRAAGLPGRVVPVTAEQVAGLPTAALPDRLSAGVQLTTLPQLARTAAGSATCLVLPASGAVAVQVPDAGVDPAAGSSAVPGSGQLQADRVLVPAGTGGLVSDRPDGTAETSYLLADDGVKYPVTSPAAAAALGFGKLSPVVLSTAVLALLPSGPSLDQAAAQQVVPAGAR